MEEWTGHELAHAVNQVLLTLMGSAICKWVSIWLFRITILQKGVKLFRKQMPTILHDSVFNDIKGTPEPEPTNDEDNSDVLMYDKNGPPPNEVSKAPAVAIDPPPSIDVPKLQFKPKLPIYMNPMVSKLCNYIMSIDDEEALK